jgi:hypothetical protein
LEISRSLLIKVILDDLSKARSVIPVWSYSIRSLICRIWWFTNQGSLLQRSRTRRLAPIMDRFLPESRVRLSNDKATEITPTLSLSCPGSLSNSIRASSLCTIASVGKTVRSHMQVSAYLKGHGEASVPHAVPLDIGEIEWCVQWLSAFRHAENKILVLCVQVQECTCSVALLLCCYILFEPEASDASNGGVL